MAAPPVSIKLRCGSWQQLQAIYKRDLARGSIFLKSTKPPPIGTGVRIDLTLPTESMIVLNGFVHEHIPEGGLGGRGPGVDVKLATIPQSAMWLIETALTSAQKGTQAMQAIPRPASEPAPASPADAGLDEGADLASAETELLDALTAEHESLRRLNPFQVLGVGYEAGDADVRAAFGELTKKYHPDRYARYASADLRNHAAEIFILIRDAYRRIGDAKGRQSVLAQLGPRKSPPAPPARAQTAPAMPPPPAAPTVITTPMARPSRSATTPPPRQTTSVAAPPPAPGATTDALPPRPQPPAASLPISLTASEGAPTDYSAPEALLDQGKYDEALAVYKIYARKNPNDRNARAGMELAEGLKALAQRDRMEAAQRFEAVLEIDPSHERAARELADMRRLATNERKGLLSRLLGKKE